MSATPQRPLSPRTLLGITVFAVLALLATAGVKSYRDLAAARAHEESLERQIEAARGRIETLAERLGRLENDPHTLERVAREELGMVRPEDVVIVLPEEGEETP